MSRREPASAGPAELSPAAALALCIFLAGRGGHGKSLLARWLAERAFAAGRTLVIADGDRTNRVLSHYFDGVLFPGDADEATTARWLD